MILARRLLLVSVIVAGAVGAARVHRSNAVPSLAPRIEPAAPGVLPTSWINGSLCGIEPQYQVHAYNDDTYIIRQSKCLHFEAPFMYLLFGEDTVLLMDTGSTLSGPIAAVVSEVIDAWLVRHRRDSIEFIVAHTHSHFDHHQGDAQFAFLADPPVVVGLDQASVEAFWGFRDFPNDIVTIDLGGRVLDVIGTPGHHPASVTLYDRNTHLLLTGDVVYPGHIFIFDPAHVAVLERTYRRLIGFASTHPVEWMLGCHIEMSATPGAPFAYGSTVHPNEHRLELAPSVLVDMLRAAEALGAGEPLGADPLETGCRIYDEFVIHPVYDCGIFWNG